MAKGVDEICGDEICDALALFGGEARAVVIGLGTGEIDLGVRSVEISADDDRLLSFEKLEIGKKGRIPEVLAKWQAREVGFAIGSVDVD